MATTKAQAEKLCTKAELELFVASLGKALEQLDAATLRKNITRARTLRDKAADLFKQQAKKTQSKTGTKRGESGQANARTEQKRVLFNEALERFEARLAALEPPVKQTAPPKKSPTKAAVAKPKAEPKAPKKSVAKKSAAAKKEAPAKKAAAAKKAAPAKKSTGKVSPTAKRAAKKAEVAARAEPVAAPAPVSKKAKVPPSGAKVTPRPPVTQRDNVIPKVVAIRGKAIGGHSRAANNRKQAKRAAR